MRIEPKLTGWQSIKSKLIAVIRIANQVSNARITRSGSQDSISFSGNAMVINLKQFPKAKAGGVGGSTPLPLTLAKIDDTTVAVRWGTVEDVVPTISGTALDPDHKENTITISGATTLWLKATSTGDIDTDGIDAVSIETSEPTADTASQAKRLLGSVAWANSKISGVASNLTGSQNVDSCGTSHSWNVV
jgi:hypothetical protein